MTTPQRRWSHVTFASFRNRAGGGGWHTGPSVGADQVDEQLVAEYAPTSLVPTRPIDDFISAAEITELPRRFEYLPLADKGLFMQSVPAGKDATGRPGNVFTHAFIDHDLAQPLEAVYPVNFYRSPDLLTPFRIASVSEVELSPDLQEPRRGPLADLSVAWTMVTTMLGDRSGALYRLQDVLSEGKTTPVLTVKNANEAVYWLQVLSSTLSPGEARRHLRFSTFERSAALLTKLPGQAYPVLVAPLADKADLARREGISLIDPGDPETREAQPGSTWSELTKGVFTEGPAPLKVVELLMAEPEAESPKDAHFGDGLARLVGRRPGLFPEGLGDVAKQHFRRRREEQPTAASNPDVELVRRVVGQPELVLEQHMWPEIGPDLMPERSYYELADEARAGIAGLHDQPTAVLVNYLDFLLRTGLVPRADIAERAFRDQFNRFPSFRGWQITPRPTSADPDLQTLLELAGQDRREILYANQRRDERLLRNLSAVNSIATILVWLRYPDTPDKLRRLGRIIVESETDYSPDLLRLYYAVNVVANISPVITGDREKDDALMAGIANLTFEAVEKHTTEGPVSYGDFESLGERIAREDILGAGHEPRTLQAVETAVREHLDEGQLLAGTPATRKILATVARGIVNEMGRTERAEADA